VKEKEKKKFDQFKQVRRDGGMMVDEMVRWLMR